MQKRPDLPGEEDEWGAYFADFKRGKEGWFSQSKRYYIRCVRELRQGEAAGPQISGRQQCFPDFHLPRAPSGLLPWGTCPGDARGAVAAAGQTSSTPAMNSPLSA